VVHFWALISTTCGPALTTIHYNRTADWTQSIGMVFSLILLAPSWGGMINGIMTLSGAWHNCAPTDPQVPDRRCSSTAGRPSRPMMSIKTINALSLHRLDGRPRAFRRAGWVDGVIGALVLPDPAAFGKDSMFSTEAGELHSGVATIGVCCTSPRCGSRA